MSQGQGIKWGVHAVVEKREHKNGPVVERLESKGNIVTDPGAERVANLIAGETEVALTSSSVRLGVGDDTTSATASDTALSTGTDEYYQVLDSGFPSVSSESITFRAEYDETEANFLWNCWGVDVDDTESVTAGGTANELFNRKVFTFGEKDGGVWSLTVVISLS